MEGQIILNGRKACEELGLYLQQRRPKKLFLVCGRSFYKLRIRDDWDALCQRANTEIVMFSDFEPNPTFQAVTRGISLFQQTKCDGLVAIGGGSAIDVAKCVKLYGNESVWQVDLEHRPKQPVDVPFIAMPTTAGSGSEATQYAVIYKDHKKISVSDDRCMPALVLLDPSVLATLPLYQKKATMLDALCHSIEAFWSLHSNRDSKRDAAQAIGLILENHEASFHNEENAYEKMLLAANLAGKAINISQTTAGHAMSYQLTSLFGIAHGHAVALCVRRLWGYLRANAHRCIDPRGESYLVSSLEQLASSMGCATPREAEEEFGRIVDELALPVPHPTTQEYQLLCNGVNETRLKNFPVPLGISDIDDLYHQIMA